LLDGSSKIDEMIRKVKDSGMTSVAITDHGVMFGVIDFYKKAVEHGVKPIIGSEVYVASGSRFDKENRRDNFYYHLVLLAENEVGYHNIIKLVSAGFTEGFYYKPRVDKELLRERHEGVIALSACLSGPVAKTLLTSNYDRAKEQALIYDDIFGRGSFFLELQEHGLEEQRIVNPQLTRMSRETGIPLVCTNDSHYINADDADAHDVLICIQTNKTVLDADRMAYKGGQFYVKSPEEMAALFPYAPEALENTVKIAERCNVEIKFHEYKLPKFHTPNGEDAFEYLKELCVQGLRNRYDDITESLRERLEYELGVIRDMGFIDYFLIVWDFIKYARDNGIMVGPGRGSAAGSVVSYCLCITDIDPIRHNLIFERFLNPERISMPDIDIDFCYERRQEVIDYVIGKYGADHVAQIITFGTMGARSVVRDVGRALAMPYAVADKIAKMIPFALGMTIKKALDMNPELRGEYNSQDDIKALIDMSLKLEGLPRHASTHAAGVVICDEPVTNHVPLNQNDGVVTTQFSMNTLEELGLLKMDFLGLRTLTVIQSALNDIKRNYGVSADFGNYDDPNVYALIRSAKTEGVFQLESSGMKSFIKELQPERFEDIIAGIALFRPGPMDFIPKYVSCKRGGEARYAHPALEPILKETYGCIVYQEQVMRIFRELAGYSLGRSDIVRRAMSKKKADVLERERENFINGARAFDVDRRSAEAIFDEMSDFAKYAFNKSHAAAYAVIGYQTAWLKVKYPVEFMAALLTSVMDFTPKVVEYIGECKKMGITVAPPDINASFSRFASVNEGISFGLTAVKNVGRGAIDAILNERDKNGPYKSLTDFARRLDGKDVNKRCAESLIKAGAFDCIGAKRSQCMHIFKSVMDGAAQDKKRNLEGQISFFDMGAVESSTDIMPDLDEFPVRDMLAYEKEALGMYISGHPLSEYKDFLDKNVTMTSAELAALGNKDDGLTGGQRETTRGDGSEARVGGIIVGKSVKYTKNSGKPMAFLTVEDLYGALEIVVFSKTYERYMNKLTKDAVIAAKGRVDTSGREDEAAKIICDEIIFYGDAPETKLWVKIPAGMDVDGVMDILSSHKGDTQVVLYVEETGRKFKLKKERWVRADERLIGRLRDIVGDARVMLT
jgi:DNA polymerase-3 subunit alpha